MSGRECADIVFCMDASGSMKECFHGVSKHIGELMERLVSNHQMHWDVRFDFLAFQNGNHDEGLHWFRSVNYHASSALVKALYGGNEMALAHFFTADVEQFSREVEAITKEPLILEEEQLLALDIAMDYPWRPADQCHRVVVLMTDETVESGIFVEKQLAKLSELRDKVDAKHIKLFVIAPECESFYELTMADHSEYQQVPEYGLDCDFSLRSMIAEIGASLSSKCHVLADEDTTTKPLPLFGQASWLSNPDIFADDYMDEILAQHLLRQS